LILLALMRRKKDVEKKDVPKTYRPSGDVKLMPTLGTKSCNQPPTLAPVFGVMTRLGKGVR